MTSHSWGDQTPPLLAGPDPHMTSASPAVTVVLKKPVLSTLPQFTTSKPTAGKSNSESEQVATVGVAANIKHCYTALWLTPIVFFEYRQ